jgi:hypothetical protein
MVPAVPGRLAYRDALAGVMSAAAVPYGYTVSLWCAGALMTHYHGIPDPLDVALFAAGALGAYTLLGYVLAGGAEPTRPAAGRTRTVAGALNWLAAGLAVATVLALAQVPGAAAWALSGGDVTVVYPLVAAAQLAWVARERP